MKIFALKFIFLFSTIGKTFGFFINSNIAKIQKNLTQEAAGNFTKFYLYTRSNIRDGQLINISNFTESNFTTSNPIRIIIHGWHGSNNSSELLVIKDEYLKKGDFNVIMVDWSFASSASYIFLSSYIVYIGQTLGVFINQLLQLTGISSDSVYLIGYSMGAHIAGYASKILYPNLVNTIFALDPAGPIFEEFNLHNKLSRKDAKYVESIHTNIEGDLVALGHIKPMGKASFYPAYGRTQPGCIIPFCSHQRAIEYFAESINSKIGFVGRKCKNYEEIQNKTCDFTKLVLMGGEPSRTNRNGVFYVEVNSRRPFAGIR